MSYARPQATLAPHQRTALASMFDAQAAILAEEGDAETAAALRHRSRAFRRTALVESVVISGDAVHA